MGLSHGVNIPAIDNLVLMFDFANTKSYPGSGSTLTVLDLSGNNNTGTLSQTNGDWPYFVSGNKGYIKFPGYGFFEVPYSASISPTNQISVCCWAQLTANCQTIIRKNTSDYLLEWGDGLSGTAGSHLQWYLNTGAGAYMLYSNNPLNYNTWYHLVGTYTAAIGGSLFANGSALSVSTNGANTGTILSSGSYLRVGAYLLEYFIGNIAQVSIYNKALSATEVQKLYNAQKSRFGL